MENQSITIKKLHLIIIIVASILVGSLGTVLITKINNNSVGDVDLFDGLYMDVSGKTMIQQILNYQSSIRLLLIKPTKSIIFQMEIR